MLYREHLVWARFKHTMLVEISTNWICVVVNQTILRSRPWQSLTIQCENLYYSWTQRHARDYNSYTHSTPIIYTPFLCSYRGILPESQDWLSILLIKTIMSVMNVSIYIIRVTAILAIMSISTFTNVLIL